MIRIAVSAQKALSTEDLALALAAQETKEPLALLIHDTQMLHERSDADIVALFELFGITFDQILYETKNLRHIQAMAIALLHDKKAFNCFCSDTELKKRGANALYDNFCFQLPPEEVIDNPKPFCVRIKNEPQGTFDSFILLNQNKEPSHTFSQAIIDMLHGVKNVVDFDSYKKQHFIQKQLGYHEEIQSLQINKPKKAFVIKQLLEDGYLPQSIQAWILSSNTEEIKALQKINQKKLKNLSNKELSRYVGFVDEDIGKLAKLYLDEFYTTKELKAKIAVLFTKKKCNKEAKMVVDAIQQAPFFENFADFEVYLMEQTKLQKEQLNAHLCYLLTGTKNSIPAQKLYDALKNYLKEIVKC